MIRRLWLVLASCISAAIGTSSAASPVAAEATAAEAIIYFVRHGQVDPRTLDQSLSAEGMARAKVLAATLRDVRFTHVFSSHTTRSRQFVEPVARANGLDVVALPRPGSELDGALVNDRLPSTAAIGPLAATLRALPPGSVALVGVNSSNAYAIMHALGIRAGTPERPCVPGDNCVPCADGSCFPRDDGDRLWILLRGVASPRLLQLRYGAR